jgi:hypothetical protein
MKPDPIRGQTFRWHFDDGQMKGKTFEHAFDTEGSVTYRAVGAGSDAKGIKAHKTSIERISDDVYAVSYLGSGGYTLTTVMNFKTRELVSFASNEKEVQVQHGTFEAPKAKA